MAIDCGEAKVTFSADTEPFEVNQLVERLERSLAAFKVEWNRPPEDSIPFGPVACRDLICGGSCGLASIHLYRKEAATQPIPTDEIARTFGELNGLNVERVLLCNRGC